MLPSPDDRASSRDTSKPAAEFSPQERHLLLGVAHEAIASALENRELALDPPSPHLHLNEPRGVFTTIYCRGELRGCVGYVFPEKPLCRAVAETARSAAFEDPRFPPITRQEAGLVEVSLSILSPLFLISADDVKIGRHGLLVAHRGHRGLLLPQVSVEHGWDRVTFLEETCRKAGLPVNAWKEGATLEAFSAEVFGDRE